MSELLENNLYFNTGTIPEITKNGRFYKFVWEEASLSSTINIYLTKQWLLPTTGKPISDYAYILFQDESNTNQVGIDNMLNNPSTTTGNPIGLQRIFVAPSNLHSNSLQDFGSDKGIIVHPFAFITGAGFTRYMRCRGNYDFEMDGTFTTKGTLNSATPIGTMYDIRCKRPNNFHLVNFGVSAFAVNTQEAAQNFIPKISMTLPQIQMQGNVASDGILFLGTAKITDPIPSFSINIAVEDIDSGSIGHFAQYGEDSMEKSTFWAEFYMGDV